MELKFNSQISTQKNLIKPDSILPDMDFEVEDWGGLRRMGFIKKNRGDLPLISIITVVKNGISTLREAFESIFIQTYDNIELIVIDGKSDDGTLDLIKSNDQHIDLWISAEDSGIYDAMNKGLDLAKGQYIHFLNSDDHYSFNRVVELVMDSFRKHGSRLINTNVLMLNPDRGFGWIRHSNVSRYYYLFKGMPQQAFFYEKSLFDDYGRFDLDFPVVADLEFLLRITKRHHVYGKYLNIPSVIFLSGGISADMERKKAQREDVIERYYSKNERLFFRNSLFKRLLTKNEMRGKKKSFIEKSLG